MSSHHQRFWTKRGPGLHYLSYLLCVWGGEGVTSYLWQWQGTHFHLNTLQAKQSETEWLLTNRLCFTHQSLFPGIEIYTSRTPFWNFRDLRRWTFLRLIIPRYGGFSTTTHAFHTVMEKIDITHWISGMYLPSCIFTFMEIIGEKVVDYSVDVVNANRWESNATTHQ